MVGIQTTTVHFLESVVVLFGLQSVEGEFDVSNAVVVGTENALDGGIGRIGRALAIARRLIDAYHLEREVAHLDILAKQRLEVLRLQLLGLLVSQHQHLTLFLQVDVVDVTSAYQRALDDAAMNGIDAHNLQVHVLLAIGHCGTMIV